MADSIPSLADDCLDREFLSGFFNGWIEHENDDVDLGQTDQALIEKTLSHLEDGQDLLLINPFSYSLVPALISAAYTFAADTRTDAESVGSTNYPLLLFPKRGYIGDIDSFTYRDTVSGGSVVEKQNVGDPADIEPGNTVYRVTDESILQSSGQPPEIGLLFVDLRKDLWQSNVVEFEDFARRNDVRSVLYYADDRNFATENAADMVDEELEVTRETIAEATTNTLGDTPSRARREEYILSRGVDVSITSIDPGELGDRFDELYESRTKIQDVAPDLYAVPEINNLLTELAVKPSLYDEQVQGNFYYNSTIRLIEGIEEYMSKVDETVASRLNEYWRLADELRAELEDQNPKERILKKRVQEASETDEETIFVARNRMHRDAIERALFLDDIDLGANTELVTKSEVEPIPDAKHVFVNLPGQNHPLYAFPPSTEVEFLTYPFLSGVVRRELYGNEPDPDDLETDTSTDTSVSITNDEEVGRPDTVEFSPAEIETDVARSLTSHGGSGTKDSSEVSSQSENEVEEGARVRIEFGDGSSRETSSQSMVTILDSDAETVRRRRAEDIVPSDKVVILGDATTDLYETITQERHEQESIQQREMLIERWREILNDGLEADYSPRSLLTEMQDQGSELQSAQTIESWADGGTLGPRHEEDVGLVLKIIRPGSESAAEEIHDAMRYIRTLHRRIGRRVHRIVEAELDPTREARFESGIGNQFNNIEDKIAVKNVSDVRTI